MAKKTKHRAASHMSTRKSTGDASKTSHAPKPNGKDPGAELLTMDHAIALLKTTRPTFYRWLRSGKLKGTKVGRQWRFRREDIDRFVTGQGPRIELTADIDPFIRQVRLRLEELNQPVEPDPSLSQTERAARLMICLGRAMRASDLHLAPHLPEKSEEAVVALRYRVDGVLHHVADLDRRLLAPLIEQLKTMAGCDRTAKEKPQDGRIMLRTEPGGDLIDLRANFLPSALGESLTARLLDRSLVAPSLDRINFSQPVKDKLRRWVEAPWGLIIVTGPTGCGKTTTLYACLCHVAKPEIKVMTVEDPVEFLFPWMIQTQVDEAAGMTFPVAMNAMLRSDPDVIMVGALRDPKVLWLAQAATLTGHLVMSTLHTTEAAGALVRMLDMGSEPFLITDTTKLIVAQRLVRTLCPHCSVATLPDPNLMRRAEQYARTGGLDWSSLDKGFREPRGCAKCGQLGFAGRDVIAEALEVTPEIAAALNRGASVDELRTIAVGQGMATIAADGIRKAANGVTTLEEINRVMGLR
ncbi:MAG: Flp pilus assembly complex ATPase component TadA [Phycisphaerae bacterium]|nr:Flp pilus assembly complex ATPase component TadA [Phycisphaerae bacterium]